MSASPESVGHKYRNMTVNECFQSRSTVLQGQPFGGIPTVLVLNIILWVFVVLLYSFLRKAAWDYGRLALLIHNDSLTSLIYGEQSEKSSPSEISLEAERRDRGFSSWFFNSLTMRDRDLINKCGDDARIYITFQYHLIIYVLILCIPSLGIILPINYIGTVLDWNSHFGRTTIVNVSTESKFLWLHSLFAFLYFLINFAFMGHHCLGFVPKKNLHFTRTLMITYVPTEIQDPEIISKHFHEAYPGCVVTRVHFCYDVRHLIDLDDQRRHAMRGRLYYTAKAKKTGKTGGALTDEFHAELNRVQLKKLDLIFVTFQDAKTVRCIYNDYKYICCGRHPKQSSVTTIIRNNHWRVAHAPHPRDIIWKHLSIRRFGWWARFVAINTFLFFLFFFLTTPAIVINTIDMYNVTRPFEKMQPNRDSVLPLCTALGLHCDNAYAGLLIRLPRGPLDKIESEPDHSEQMLHLPGVYGGHSALHGADQLLHVFLRWLFDIYYLEHATIRFHIAGPLPQCVFLPDNGAFFINYVITAALLGTGMELMRLGSLCTYCTRLFLSKSEPERVHIRKNQATDFQFGREYAWMSNVFSVVMAYSITCPIIVPFGLLYLCMKHITDRYNMYYSYAPTKLNAQIHMAAVYQAIFAPLLGLFWMLFFSILRVGSLHSITLFTLSSLIISTLIAFSGIFLGKLRIAHRYEPEEETETVFDVEPSSTTSTPTSLNAGPCWGSASGPKAAARAQVLARAVQTELQGAIDGPSECWGCQLYVATVLQDPELNLTPASSPARHTYGTINSQPEEGEEESGLRGFARELDSTQFQEGLELEGQSH
ncbi:Calcium permeable stress-gated cation channel 1 [Apodemus speciosus]|uniref:Calcium permeable stress-gated cation channel 1 n=1 Tax=Apodemus speciosus TaxID=105296 RepID=A0ABQ0FEI7_APOSI